MYNVQPHTYPQVPPCMHLSICTTCTVHALMCVCTHAYVVCMSMCVQACMHADTELGKVIQNMHKVEEDWAKGELLGKVTLQRLIAVYVAVLHI